MQHRNRMIIPSRYRGPVLALLIGSLLCPMSSIAEVATDGTLGPIRSLSGSMTIDQALGRRAGDNLFHSFRLFNINQGESATFTGSADIANVIGRVTGGNASRIDGRLKSDIGHTGFFLINPSGVVFGPEAQVDVPGSFHVSTADRVNFPDGYYSATDTAGSRLSIATPESFGFLTQQPAADIRVEGSQLELRAEQTLSMVGGHVTTSVDWNSFSLARVSSEGGTIRMVAVGEADAANRVLLHDGSSDLPPRGRVEVSWGSSIDVSGVAGSESMLLRGGEVEVSLSTLAALHVGDGDSPGTIHIDADDISIRDSGIYADTWGDGRGNSIVLQADNQLRIENSTVSADNDGAGTLRANMQLSARDIEIVNSDVRSLVSGSGAGADIEVTADSLTIDAASAVDGFSRLRTRILDGSSGVAGDIRVRARQVLLTDGGQISSIVDAGGTGTGGTLDLSVGESLIARGWNSNSGNDVYSGLITTMLSPDGQAGGDILVSAPNARLSLDGAIIQAATAGSGDSGDIRMSVRDLKLEAESWIMSATQAEGAAGDIDIEIAESASLLSGSSMETWSYPENTGMAGNLRLKLGGNLVLDSAKIDSSTSGDLDAGNLSIDVGGDFDMKAGSWLDAASYANGAAGDIEVRAEGSIRLQNASEIRSFTDGTGPAGTISLIAGGGVELKNSDIDSFTRGTGHAGTISLIADGDVELQDSDLSARSFTAFDGARLGDAGQIRIAAESSSMLDSSLGVTSSSRANAGSIEVLTRGDIRVDTTGDDLHGLFAGNTGGYSDPSFDPERVAVEGKSGNIRLAAATIVFRNRSRMDIGTSRGDGGNLVIDAESLDLLDGATISTTTSGPGKAGDVRIALSDRLLIQGQDPVGLTRAGIETGTLEMSDVFDVPAGSIGPAGSIDIDAEQVIVGANGVILSDSFSNAPAGDLRMNLATLEIRDGGEISSSTSGPGDAGNTLINARESVTVTGIGPNGRLIFPSSISASASLFNEVTGGDGGDVQIVAPRIAVEQGAFLASSTGSNSAAGTILLRADQLIVQAGGRVRTDTFGAGNAGDIDVQANNILIDGRGTESLPIAWRATGISSAANGAFGSQTGNAGAIELVAIDAVDLVGRAEVSTNTATSGDAGRINVAADTLTIDNASLISRAEATASGFAGDVDVDANLLHLRNAGAISTAALQRVSTERLPAAPDSGIRIDANELRMTSAAVIGAESTGNVPAGTIEIAGDSLLARQGAAIRSDAAGSGDAGSILLRIDAIELDDAKIRADTSSSGAGGSVEIVGNSLRAANGARILTGTSDSGAAGGIAIRLAGELALNSDAELTTSTSGSGNAGRIGIRAGILNINNGVLSSRADTAASGFAGSIDVSANLLHLRNAGTISTSSLQNVPVERLADAPDSRIHIDAGQIRMAHAAIDARSTGNVAAGAIDIQSGAITLANLSRITTESMDADGGPIDIAASSLWLADSQITTSVLGTSGDGGDIRIVTELLGMDGGFMQANTAAAGAAGGDLLVLAEQAVLSRGYVQVGGNERLNFQPGLGFNVIQAAAPDGVQGNIQTSVPELDVTRGLTELATPVADPAALVRDRCLAASPGAGSSLVEQPFAGLEPASAAAVSFAGARLDRLLRTNH